MGRDSSHRWFRTSPMAVTARIATDPRRCIWQRVLISPLANALAVPLFTLVLVPIVSVGHAVCCRFSVGWVRCTWLRIAGPRRMLARLRMARGATARDVVSAGCLRWYHVALGSVPCVGITRIRGRYELQARFYVCRPLVFGPHRRRGSATTALVARRWPRLVSRRQDPIAYARLDAGPPFERARFRRARRLAVSVLVAVRDWIDHLVIVMRLGPPRRHAVTPARYVDSLNSLRAFGRGLRRIGSRTNVRVGQRWQLGWVVLRDLASTTELRIGSDNDTSCVVRIVGARGLSLLTGDIEAEAEEELLDAGFRTGQTSWSSLIMVAGVSIHRIRWRDVPRACGVLRRLSKSLEFPQARITRALARGRSASRINDR